MPLDVLTALQQSNLDNLISLRDLCRRSAADAAWVYAIDHDTIGCYAALSDPDLLSLATELDASVVVPRYTGKQLLSILAKPRNSRGIFAAVLEPDKSRAGIDGASPRDRALPA